MISRAYLSLPVAAAASDVFHNRFSLFKRSQEREIATGNVNVAGMAVINYVSGICWS